MNVKELREALEGLDDETPVIVRTWGEWEGVSIDGEDIEVVTTPRTATAETGCGESPAFVLDCYELEEERQNDTEPAPAPRVHLTVVK